MDELLNLSDCSIFHIPATLPGLDWESLVANVLRAKMEASYPWLAANLGSIRSFGPVNGRIESWGRVRKRTTMEPVDQEVVLGAGRQRGSKAA